MGPSRAGSGGVPRAATCEITLVHTVHNRAGNVSHDQGDKRIASRLVITQGDTLGTQ